jgi:hypothetical protein
MGFCDGEFDIVSQSFHGVLRFVYRCVSKDFQRRICSSPEQAKQFSESIFEEKVILLKNTMPLTHKPLPDEIREIWEINGAEILGDSLRIGKPHHMERIWRIATNCKVSRR